MSIEPAQAIADLVWVVESPSFVGGDSVAGGGVIKRIEIDGEHLAAFLNERASHRVGRYFENLLLYWFRHVRRVQVVGNGIQVKDANRTIGEIDFLFRDEQDRLTHCEAAVKFFLHHPNAAGSHFPGPNTADNFEQKASKLFDRQLQLSVAHYPDVEVRQAFVRGMLFYRGAQPSTLPARMAPDHLTGRWLRHHELDRLEPRTVGTVVHKPHWLAPNASAELVDHPQLISQLEAHFATRDHPLMVSLRDPDDHCEIERLFVVADSWARDS